MLSPLNNPFIINQFPVVKIDQLPMIINCMALQMEELDIHNFNLMNF